MSAGAVKQLEERVKALELAILELAEALLAWHEAPTQEERNKRSDDLSAALREALK